MVKIELNKETERLLTLLFLRGVVSRETLISTRENIRTAQITIRKISGAGLIKEMDTPVLYKAGETRKSVHVYSLTPDGLRYLADMKINPLFSKILTEETRRIGIAGKRGRDSNWRGKIIKINEAGTLAQIAGAETPLLFFEEPTARDEESERKSDKNYIAADKNEKENTVKNTYYSLARKAISKLNENELKQLKTLLTFTYITEEKSYAEGQENNMGFHFLSPDDITKMLTESRPDLSMKDFHRCRHSGLYQSDVKTVLVYSLLEPTMAWSSWFVDREEMLYGIYNTHIKDKALRENVISNGSSALIIVKNARHFASLYFDYGKKRRNGEILGSNFDRLYIVPMSYEGAMHLQNDIMLTYDADEEQEFINTAKEKGYEENTNHFKYSAAFPVISPDGIYIANGYVLNVNLIHNMERAIKLIPDARYAICCYPWQEPYYNAVFGDRVILKAHFTDPGSKEALAFAEREKAKAERLKKHMEKMENQNEKDT